MPGFNRKGPMGQGSMTGHKMGRCTNFWEKLKNQDSATTDNPNKNIPENFRGRGLGYGRNRGGRGLGLGWRNRLDDWS